MQSFTEIRFNKGENIRFFGAERAAKNQGYPDVLSYLRFTGQVKGWCEVVPQGEVDESLLAETLRSETRKIGRKYPLVSDSIRDALVANNLPVTSDNMYYVGLRYVHTTIGRDADIRKAIAATFGGENEDYK